MQQPELSQKQHGILTALLEQNSYRSQASYVKQQEKFLEQRQHSLKQHLVKNEPINRKVMANSDEPDITKLISNEHDQRLQHKKLAIQILKNQNAQDREEREAKKTEVRRQKLQTEMQQQQDLLKIHEAIRNAQNAKEVYRRAAEKVIR